MEYIATFYSHFGAVRFMRLCRSQGLPARMAPVPRDLSSSCGTCVFYQAEDACYGLLDTDTEAVYRLSGGAPELLREFE